MHNIKPVLPSLLNSEIEMFQKKLDFAKEVSSSIHIDYIDGEFAPGRTLAIEKWPEIKLNYSEVHLMVNEPIQYLDALKKKNISRVIVHAESQFSIENIAAKTKELDLLFGITVNPNTDLKDIQKFYSFTNYYQIMGVVPGKIGQKMIPDTPSAVHYLKHNRHRLVVTVDGGIKIENILALKNAGADYFITSQALYHNDDWVDNYHYLSEALNGH